MQIIDSMLSAHLYSQHFDAIGAISALCKVRLEAKFDLDPAVDQLCGNSDSVGTGSKFALHVLSSST